MKLYYSSGTCSLSPRIVIEELGLPISAVAVSLKTHTLEDGSDYYAINPKGYVPLLELDGGERISEGPAIVQYLADLKPEMKLAPANGTLARTQLQSLLSFINSEIHKGFSPLFDRELSTEIKPHFRNKLGKRLTDMVELLGSNTYLMGEQFTVADAYLFNVLGWCGFVGVDLAGGWPALEAYRQRVAQRPAVQRAMKAEGWIK
ncbi:MAG TPA: glutathione transferase GstA [Limnobacter sp.]|uniref:glutathione transferase GstA n=1 Tax=Limnobacter sp. TaxID=2003368 RepID=UPI002EDA519D